MAEVEARLARLEEKSENQKQILLEIKELVKDVPANTLHLQNVMKKQEEHDTKIVSLEKFKTRVSIYIGIIATAGATILNEGADFLHKWMGGANV